jgi:hypothetical protein
VAKPEQLYFWYPMPRLVQVEFRKPKQNFADTVTGISIRDDDQIGDNQTMLTVYPMPADHDQVEYPGGIEIYGELLVEMTNPVTGTFFEWDQDEFTSDEKVMAMLDRLRIRINTAARQIAERSIAQ